MTIRSVNLLPLSRFKSEGQQDRPQGVMLDAPIHVVASGMAFLAQQADVIVTISAPDAPQNDVMAGHIPNGKGLAATQAFTLLPLE